MIDPNELRLGNWVIHPDNGFWQWQFSRDDWDLYEMKKFDPIELTPEILEKCGFIKDSVGIWSNEQIEFDSWSDKTFSFSYNSEKAPTQLLYLHQLQNLHFDITGTELAFNHKALSRSH